MIVFIDFAQVDGNDYVKWPKVMQACRDSGSRLGGAIFRGAYGTSPDPTIGREWKRAQSYGLTTGAYLFLRNKKEQPPADQVHVFADVLGALTEQDFVPAIDIEDTWPSEEPELEALHQAWSEMVAIFGVTPMLYDSRRIWREDLHNLPAGEMLESPQWVAKPWLRPVHSAPVLTPESFAGGQNVPYVPGPWGDTNWWMHQYQGDAFGVPGITNTVDLSRFNLMQQGAAGPRVSWVQKRLGVTVDGIFGPVTASRLRSFQASHGLVSDAVVGPLTFNRLCWTRTRI